MPLLSHEDYVQSIKQLYPVGEYWDAVFSDSESELSLYVDGLAASAKRAQDRFVDLLMEAFPNTANELITDYERVFEVTPEGELSDRQNHVITEWIGSLFRPTDWDAIAAEYSFTLTLERQKMFCCGLSSFGDQLWDVSARSFLDFSVTMPIGTEDETKVAFEAKMWALSPPNYYLNFNYPRGWYDIAEEFGFTLTDSAEETYSLDGARLEDLLWGSDAKYYLTLEMVVPAGTTSEEKENFETEISSVTAADYFIEFNYTEESV